jgi:hypothetical protein
MKQIFSEEYKEKQEDIEITEGLLTGVEAAATALGYSVIGGLSLFGGAMLIAGLKRAKLGDKLVKLFKKISGKNADIDLKKGVRKLSDKSTYSNEYNSYKNTETAKKLFDVLEAIKRRNYEAALEAYKASGVYETAEAVKVISLAVAEEFKEPPLYYISPGNESYQFLKRIIGPRMAKAVSDSVLYALNKNKGYFIDIDIEDVK